MDASDPKVARILQRAEHLSEREARALDTALREQVGVELAARRTLEAHQRFLNATAMFEHWPDPALEMAEGRRRVAIALGMTRAGRHEAIEPDDGSVA